MIQLNVWTVEFPPRGQVYRVFECFRVFAEGEICKHGFAKMQDFILLPIALISGK